VPFTRPRSCGEHRRILRSQQVRNWFSLNIAVLSPVCVNATQDSDVRQEPERATFPLADCPYLQSAVAWV